jgi:hypothetical protein
VTAWARLAAEGPWLEAEIFFSATSWGVRPVAPGADPVWLSYDDVASVTELGDGSPNARVVEVAEVGGRRMWLQVSDALLEQFLGALTAPGSQPSLADPGSASSGGPAEESQTSPESYAPAGSRDRAATTRNITIAAAAVVLLIGGALGARFLLGGGYPMPADESELVSRLNDRGLECSEPESGDDDVMCLLGNVSRDGTGQISAAFLELEDSKITVNMSYLIAGATGGDPVPLFTTLGEEFGWDEATARRIVTRKDEPGDAGHVSWHYKDDAVYVEIRP